jgi:BASS family bile acid:Na+ symporter
VLVIPILFWATLRVIGRDQFDPGLVLALSLQAGAAPIMATPAVALLFEPFLTKLTRPGAWQAFG